MKPSQPRLVLAPPLPNGAEKDKNFLESSFFQIPNQHLPTPEQVRALSTDLSTSPQPKPVIFTDPDIFVKFGRYVSVGEAQCLWMVRQALGDKVPVPEVFGWRVDDEGYVFIYMELIQGETLLDRWEHLTSLDKEGLRDHLSQILADLRQLKQNCDQYIGSLNRDKLPDYVFQSLRQAGPFPSIREFNDWFSSLPQARLAGSQRYTDPYRHLLPDDGDIKFTHGDLHRGNIMVSSTSPPRILAIVDWGQAGWYPDYWEYCKALYTCWYEDEWRQDWIDRVLEPRFEESQVFSEYTMAIGAV
ncbi:aminoglycoside phosphotransferase family protein [Aspergillus mulundensis]|uniref:Phosphotransferase enzyme family protein n=1 Tax=Aspergillus mulundensis TaxID=1810919 RepID=A0A3D8R3T8_9EURO|nr:Phosphotransferase enzyme family protein [Aspergillus mulundensis]RDW68722.1 Phosphotransferase enzyme family protein [Aspergillus mulundensis]